MAHPLITNISPQELSTGNFAVSPQNWGVIQHPDGRIILGNTSGVLVWDGEEWEMVAGTEQKRFFKFALDEEGRIYTGGVEDLGYLGVDSIGQPTFVSLKSRLPAEAEELETIYRVVSDGKRVFFIGGEFCIRWEKEQFTVWRDESRFVRLFLSGGRAFAYRTDGLSELKEEEWELVQTKEQLGGIRLRHVAVTGDGDNGESGLWLASATNGLYHSNGSRLKRLNSGLDSLDIRNVAELEDGLFALATNGDGLYIVNASGAVKAIVNERSGLQNPQLTYPFQGIDGAIWVCNYSGLARIDYPYAVQAYGLKSNELVGVIGSHAYNGDIYIGTVQGLTVLTGDDRRAVKPENLAAREVLGFFEWDNALWMVASEGVYKKEGNKEFELVNDLQNVDAFTWSPLQPDRLFISLSPPMLQEFQYTRGAWDPIGEPVELPHFGQFAAATPDRKVWISSDEVSSVDFATQPPTVRTYGPADSLPVSEGWPEVYFLNGELLVTGDFGIRRWDHEKDHFIPDGRFGDEFASGQYAAYNLRPTRSGDIWVTTDNFTGRLIPDGQAGFSIDSLGLKTVPISEYFSIYEAPDSSIWLGGTEGLVRFDPDIERDYQRPFQCLVREVTVNNDSTIFAGTFADSTGRILTEQPAAAIPIFPYTDNGLKFRYATPFFEASDQTQYSHQLVGQDEKWTSWTSKTETEYTNLHEGEYSFRVRARNVYGTIGEVGEFRFRILAPWYRTWWAYGLYSLLALVGILLIVHLNTRRLLAAKRRLERVVDERTEEIQVQMKQLAEQKEIISEERDKSEQLLLNILPRETSEELKEKGFARPQLFDQVSVLFTDFKGFTMIAEQLSPKQLVDEINELFSEFDRITKRHGIEKIKTIGDAYMAAGGLPRRNDTHPVDVVRAALEIRDFMADYHARRVAEGRPGFEIRLGVHTGPVVAGIVGLHKFQYDIWGDTVNTAARMESSGAVGQVNISQATFEQVRDHFDCTYRGEVKAKNKGEITMYFVERKA